MNDGPMFAENLDAEDRAWLGTFKMPGAKLVEGFLGVIVWMSEDGVRRWRPVNGIDHATGDSLAGIWHLAGLQLSTMILSESTKVVGPDDELE